jgi:hypothetical protein
MNDNLKKSIVAKYLGANWQDNLELEIIEGGEHDGMIRDIQEGDIIDISEESREGYSEISMRMGFNGDRRQSFWCNIINN